MIYDDLKYKEEAHIFADQQKHVRTLLPFETFSAHLEACDDKQMIIDTTVKSYGLRVAGKRLPNTVCAIGTLERIYDKYGINVLDTVLRLAVGAWEGETNSLSGSILMGIAKIIVSYGDELKEDMFVDHVGRVSVKSIVRTAKERSPGALGYAEAMVLAYNNKNKQRLSLRALHGGKFVANDPNDYGD